MPILFLKRLQKVSFAVRSFPAKLAWFKPTNPRLKRDLRQRPFAHESQASGAGTKLPAHSQAGSSRAFKLNGIA
jgi:hypothetical protein